jgi:hypothetical protein
MSILAKETGALEIGSRPQNCDYIEKRSRHINYMRQFEKGHPYE